MYSYIFINFLFLALPAEVRGLYLLESPGLSVAPELEMSRRALSSTVARPSVEGPAPAPDKADLGAALGG